VQKPDVTAREFKLLGILHVAEQVTEIESFTVPRSSMGDGSASRIAHAGRGVLQCISKSRRIESQERAASNF